MKNIFFLFLFLINGTLFADEKIYSLELCLDQAIANHPRLKMMNFTLENEKAKLNIINSKYLPSIDILASYNRLESPLANDKYRAGFEISQPLFKTEKKLSETKITNFTVETIENEFLLAKTEVVFNVKVAYFKLISAYEFLEIRQNYLKHTQLFYDTAIELNRRTKLPREETLLRLKAQLNEINQDIISAQTNIKIAEKILLNAMGVDRETELNVGKNLQIKTITVTFSADAILQNPEILRIENQLKLAEQNENFLKTAMYPEVRAFYNQAYQLSDFSSRDSEWVLGVNASFDVWNFWEKGKTKTEIRRSEIKKRELEEYKNLVWKKLILELESAQLEYESALKKYHLALKSLSETKISLDLFEKRYLSGLVSSLELLDSQKTFMQAQVNVANAKFEINIAKAKIEKIAGLGDKYDHQ